MTLALFYQYKSFDRLTNVVDFNNNCVVYAHGTRAGKNVTGSCDSVERDGRIVKKNGWSDPTNNVRKCRVAIRTLHISFCLEDIMSLAYIGTCEKCLKKNEAKGKINWACSEDREFLNCGGCMYSYPRLRPRGCPTYQKLCISMFNRVQSQEPFAREPLLPWCVTYKNETASLGKGTSTFQIERHHEYAIKVHDVGRYSPFLKGTGSLFASSIPVPEGMFRCASERDTCGPNSTLGIGQGRQGGTMLVSISG